MYQRIYLDLDRTLFDTPRFGDALTAAFAQEYGVATEDFVAQIPGFYVHHGTMQYYDFYAHVAKLGYDPHEVTERLRPLLLAEDFLYPDVRSLVRSLAHAPVQVSILTYGLENFQGYKISLLQELLHIPFVATLQFKQDYLMSQPHVPSLIVDDRVVAPLPAWCSQFLIDRIADMSKSKEGERLWRINSLAVVESVLSLGYNERNKKGITDEAD